MLVCNVLAKQSLASGTLLRRKDDQVAYEDNDGQHVLCGAKGQGCGLISEPLGPPRGGGYSRRALIVTATPPVDMVDANQAKVKW